MRISVTGLRGIPASWGGVEHHCEQIYSRLAAKGHEITVYSRCHYIPYGIQSYKGITIKTIPTINTKYTEAFAHTFLSILHILKMNPDIIHIHALGPCLFSWMPRLFRPKMRVFFTCHGLDWQRKKWPKWASNIIYLGELFSVLFPHYRITVSQELQHYYQTRHNASAYYIPNGINMARKKSPNLIKKFGLSNRNYLLFVGRIVPEKRLEDTLQAFLAKSRKFQFVIVGESADTKTYMKRLKQIAGDARSILFVGYQYGEVLEELYSNARAFVTTSELEGLPLTLLEALSYGLPCIASDIAPHKEILGRLDWFMFPTGNLETLSKRMDEVEEMSEDKLNEVAEKEAAEVSDRFNWDIFAERLEKLYKESLRNPMN
jgi:glycosyltransferase involved in cell wall biosynthesis